MTEKRESFKQITDADKDSHGTFTVLRPRNGQTQNPTRITDQDTVFTTYMSYLQDTLLTYLLYLSL